MYSFMIENSEEFCRANCFAKGTGDFSRIFIHVILQKACKSLFATAVILQCNKIHYDECSEEPMIHNVKMADDHQEKLCWKRDQLNRGSRYIRLCYYILFDIFQSLRFQIRHNSFEDVLQARRLFLGLVFIYIYFLHSFIETPELYVTGTTMPNQIKQ